VRLCMKDAPILELLPCSLRLSPVATSNSPTRGRVKLPHLKAAGTG